MKTSSPFLIPAFATLAIFLAGCATHPARTPASWEPNRQTREAATPFYLVFPPKDKSLWIMPNQTLPEGTPVLYLDNRRGFYYVQLASLERGWVPKGSLKRYR